MSRASPSRRPPRADEEAGLTLVEMLIVLAVIAVAGSASVLSLVPRQNGAVEGTARRLTAAIQSSADRSLATGGAMTLVVRRGGYLIGAARTELPPGVILTGTKPAVRIAFGSEPFALSVVRGGVGWTVAFDGVEAAATPGTLP